jgi:hypothetical protein
MLFLGNISIASSLTLLKVDCLLFRSLQADFKGFDFPRIGLQLNFQRVIYFVKKSFLFRISHELLGEDAPPYFACGLFVLLVFDGVNLCADCDSKIIFIFSKLV